MAWNLMEYHRPATMQEAERLLKRRHVHSAVLAGGTALLAGRSRDLDAVVDLAALDLSYIRQGHGNIEIGAMTTLQDMVTSPLLAGFAGGLLATTAHDTATRTLRNAATAGGSIVACGPSTDVVVALLALDALVLTAAGDARPLAGLLGHSKPQPLLVQVRIPTEPAGSRSAFLRVARLPSDQAIVNVAATLRTDGQRCTVIRLAAGGVGWFPLRLHVAEQRLLGTRLAESDLDEAIALQEADIAPPSDILGSSEYRRAMLGVLLRRAVH